MADEFETMEKTAALSNTMDGLERRTSRLAASANGFASAMSRAFTSSIVGGKQFDDVLKGLALRLSGMALTAALRPLAQGLMGGINSLFAGMVGGASPKAARGAIKPFAAGGVIGTPTYFPLATGGAGLAGEAGPEAILPLARGHDGRLGVAMQGGAAASVTINIATPDVESFRRSETYIAGQIARAVARGQRSL
ncbi:MAG: phage tail tape measure protein [Xanthobacteraceae bacterium]